MMIYTIILAILSSFSYIVAGTLFVGIVVLAIRNDLVSEAIAKELQRQQPTVVATAADGDVKIDEWTNTTKRLAFEPVPPAVRIQILVNCLQKYTADRLNPLDKRLKTVDVRLTRMMDSCRRARMAYDYESSELNALCASNNRQTMTIETNTDNIETSKISKSIVVEEELELEPLAVKKVSTVESLTKSISEKSLHSGITPRSTSILSVEQTQSGLISKSLISTVPTEQPESLTDTLKELTTYLMSVITWFKNALTSQVYRRNAIKVYQVINSILKSQYLKTCFQFAFDSFDKFVKLYTRIDMNNGDMTSVVIRIPATEND